MSTTSQSFPVLYTRGTHFDVGYTIGTTFQSRIQSFFNRSDLLQKTILPYYASADGRDVVDTVRVLAERNFPQYVQELKGMAQGAGLPYETLFLNSMMIEIYFGFSRQTPRLTREDLGCSTVLINRPDLKIIGHNEDGEDLVKHFGYFVDAHVWGEDGKEGKGEEKFTAMCSPGGLPGAMMAFNKHGMTFSVNTLVAPTVGVTTPGDFLTRAALAASNIEEVQEILTNKGYGCGAGCSINVASTADLATMWSVEILPRVSESKVSVKPIRESVDLDESVYYHMNEYRHADVKVETAVRSRTRLTRALELPLPKCQNDVLNILGDNANTSYPIYRTARPTDGASTICTGIFDLIEKRFDVYFENPTKDTAPLLTFNL